MLLALILEAYAGTLEHDAALTAWRRSRITVEHEQRERSAADVYGPLVLYSWVVMFNRVPPEEVVVVEDGAGRRYTVPGLAKILKDEDALSRYRGNVSAARAGGLGLLTASVAMIGLGLWGFDDAINGSGSPAALVAGTTLIVLAPIPLWYGFDYGFGPKRRANRFERYWEEDELVRVVERRNEDVCAKLGLGAEECYAEDLEEEAAEEEEEEEEEVERLEEGDFEEEEEEQEEEVRYEEDEEIEDDTKYEEE